MINGESEATWQGDGSPIPIHAYSGGADIVVLKPAGARLFLPLVQRQENGALDSRRYKVQPKEVQDANYLKLTPFGLG